jgi:predicted DNA-binding transcriptional regulator AlpA
MTIALPYPPPFQDLRTLAQHVCLGESTIENMVRQGRFPEPSFFDGGKRLWRWKEVERWLARGRETIAASPDEQAEAIRNATRAAASRNH